MKIAKIAGGDGMTVLRASPEKLEKIVKGELEVFQTDHFHPRTHAMEKFVRQGGKIEVVREALFEILSRYPKSEKEVFQYLEFAMAAVSFIRSEELFPIYKRGFENAKEFEVRKLFLDLIADLHELEPKKTGFFDSVMKNVKDPIFSVALGHRMDLWEKARVLPEVKKILRNPDLPPKQGRRLKSY